MIIYSVRVEIKNEIFEEYIKFLITKHINDVLSTGCFNNFELKLLLNNLENSKIIYVDYHCDNETILNEYLAKHARALRDEVKKRFGDNFIATRQIMKVI